MTEPTKDRSYYRKLSLAELEELTHYGIDVNWQELAIAMAERMADIRAEVYAEISEGD